MVKILWEIPWKGMRNALFYGQNAGNTMRNAIFYFISHSVMSYHWFTNYYHIIYENMRNEKSFLVECQIRVFLYDID